MPPIERFCDLYRQLGAGNLHLLRTVYVPSIIFEDPFRRVDGLPALERYFAHMYEGVKSIRFDFGPAVVGEEAAALSWKMTVRLRNVRPSQDIVVHGASHLRYEGELVVHHRDYFDPGELIYEHVPVLGTVIRRIKARM